MKVNLRPLRLEDSAQVLNWRNSDAVAAHMYTEHKIEPDEHQRWLKGALALEDRCYWIIEADDLPVGLASIAKIDTIARRCDLGHYLADPAVRGKGVGACVEYLILQQVFEVRKLNKLWCEVLIENERAWRLHMEFGFRREAHFRAHVWKGGRFRDVLGFGLLAEEWATLRPACTARLRVRGVDPTALITREE